MGFNNTSYSTDTRVHHGKFARGVSIIGVGATPVGNVLSTPALKDLGERELGAWAAQMALEDAHVNPKDVDYLITSEVVNITYYNQMAPNIGFMDWVGMRGKGSSSHAEACAASYLALNEGANLIASGMYDIVMIVGNNTDHDFTKAGEAPYIRHPGREYPWPEVLGGDGAQAYLPMDAIYGRWNGTWNKLWDEPAGEYMKQTGISFDQMTDACDALSVSMRHNAAGNKRALRQQELIEEARANGFEDVASYLKSDKVPRLTPMHKRNHFLSHVDAGGAVVLCASEIAHRYTDKPIEITGIGVSALDSKNPNWYTRFREEAYRQAMEMAGITGEDIDIQYSTDFTLSAILQDAEITGYIPKGEAWKMALEGELSYEGEKPYNTQGGCTAYGHCWGTTLFEGLVEAVEQMRGECGDRQVQKPLKTAFISGVGAGMESGAAVLRIQE